MNRKWQRLSISDNEAVDVSFDGDVSEHFQGLPGEAATAGQLHVSVIRDGDAMRVVIGNQFGDEAEIRLSPRQVLTSAAAFAELE